MEGSRVCTRQMRLDGRGWTTGQRRELAAWAAYLRLAAHLTASSLGQGARVCLLATISKGQQRKGLRAGERSTKGGVACSCMPFSALPTSPLLSVYFVNSCRPYSRAALPITALYGRPGCRAHSSPLVTETPRLQYPARPRCVFVFGLPSLSHSPLPNTALHTTQTFEVPAEVASSTSRSQDGRGSTR